MRPFRFDLFRNAGHVQIAFRFRKSHLLCQRGNSHRVIAGNQFQCNPFLLKIGQGFCGIGSYGVGGYNVSKLLNVRQGTVLIQRFFGISCQQETFSGLFIPFQVWGNGGAQPFRSADHKGSSILELDGAPFSLRRKWNLVDGGKYVTCGKVRFQCLKSSIVVVSVLQKGTYQFFKQH